MKKILFLLYVAPFILSILSCRLSSGSDRNYDAYDPNKTYKLHLNPAPGSSYYYDISNESSVKIELEDKKVNNETKTNSSIHYKVAKDSTGNFLLVMQYDKIQMYTKTGDNETDAEAGDGTGVINPLDKMLSILKQSHITATVSPSGEILNMNGYKELGDQFLANVAISDEDQRSMLQSQWERTIGNGFVKQNLEQLFKIFPDSSVHLRDSWKLNNNSGSDFGLNAKSIFTLKAINSDVAVIGVEGEITSDNSTASAMGFSGATVSLKGKQDGEYEIEAKTGMLMSCNVTAKVEGTVQVMGQEIPVTIKTSVKISGRKEN
ncbi:MAG TPA: DUF6263 family protein [Chitinophagaceae bacterium]|nr:DUF6263 family protein [Chitinophagaceae bacterium]